MARVSVDGWIAEGGHTIIEGKKNNIILFDVVEDCNPTNGIDDDVFNTNHAWFHCSFEVNIEEKNKLSFVPEGYTLDRIQSNGWAWIVKEGDRYNSLRGDHFLYGEQVADYIKEGMPVSVSGQEILLKGPDNNILRVINVQDITFSPFWMREKPKLLTIPYKCGLFITQSQSK